jgi:hypothetical protein
MRKIFYSRSIAKLEKESFLMMKRICMLTNAFFEMEQTHGKQGKALVFREDMRKIALDKMGRALTLLAIEEVTGERA